MKKIFYLLYISVITTGCNSREDAKPAYKVSYFVQGKGTMNIDTIFYLNESGRQEILTNVKEFKKEFETRSPFSAMLRAKGRITSGSVIYDYKVTGPKQDGKSDFSSFGGPGTYSFDISKSTTF